MSRKKGSSATCSLTAVLPWNQKQRAAGPLLWCPPSSARRLRARTVGCPQGPVKLSEMLAGGGRATKGKRSEDRCFWSNFKPLDAHQPRPPRQRWLSGSLLPQLLLPPREPMALPTPLGFSSVPGQGLLPQGDFLQLSCSTQLTKEAVPESGD